MSTVQSTDKVLVQRAATLHSAPADMSTVQDTDLLLINRAGVDYKCSFADWKASQAGINKPSITSPAAGAVDLGETPTFTSSAFSGTGTTHVSSDWQVTLKTDTTFAAPVVQSMVDTTNKTSWDGGPLSTNTDYIVRVRYHGAGAVVSPWSDAVGFKTKSAFVIAVPAGDVHDSKNGAALGTAITSPVKLINLATANASLYGVGTDGKVYSHNIVGTGAMTHVAKIKETNVVQVAVSYDSSRNGEGSVVLCSDGSVVGYDMASARHPLSGGPFIRVCGSGAVNNTLVAIAADGGVYVFPASAYTADVNFGSEHFPPNAWAKTAVALPGGRTVKSVVGLSGGNYEAAIIGLLASDGTLWAAGAKAAATSDVIGGVLKTGTNAAPVQLAVGTTFQKINNIGACFADMAAICAQTTAGELWYGATASMSNSGVAVAFGPATWGAGFKEPAFGPYIPNGPIYGLKSDGYLYCSPTSGNFTFTKIPGQTKTLSALGNVRTAMQYNGDECYFIIP
jgi:hypothetical protein